MTKTLLIIAACVYLLSKPAAVSGSPCNIDTVFQSVPPIIWYEQTADGQSQRTKITRFFHNKVSVFGAQLAKCYSGAFAPEDVYQSTGILGLFLWLYFIYKVAMEKIQVLAIIVLLLPFLQILTGNQILVSISYKIFAIMGFTFLLKKL